MTGKGTCEGCRHLSETSKDYGEKPVYKWWQCPSRWDYLNFYGVWYSFWCWFNPGGKHLAFNDTNEYPHRCGHYEEM